MSNGAPQVSAALTAPCLAVTARVVELTFLNNVRKDGKNIIKRPRKQNIKLYSKRPDRDQKGALRKTKPSRWGDSHTEFEQPEWVADRMRNHNPVLYIKQKQIHLKIKLRIEFDCTDKNKSLTLKSVSGRDTLAKSKHFPGKKPSELEFFSKSPSVKKIKPGVTEVTFELVKSRQALPNCIAELSLSILWSVSFAEKKVAVSAGLSGPHALYVTLDKPRGKMAYIEPKPNEAFKPAEHSFQQKGLLQIVTEPRLRYAVRGAEFTGAGKEQDTVDKMFDQFYRHDVGYALGYRWGANQQYTYIEPKITLHHYLWLCVLGWDDGAMGECHNIAASFILACQILGVKGKFEIGYLFPRTNRSDTPPHGRTGRKKKGVYSAGGDQAFRQHQDAAAKLAHGWESLVFVDSAGGANNFEGVACYRGGSVLYAIGDVILDRKSKDRNATLYFTQRDVDRSTSDVQKQYKVSATDSALGAMDLQWSIWIQEPLTGDWGIVGDCPQPYRNETPSKFQWES